MFVVHQTPMQMTQGWLGGVGRAQTLQYNVQWFHQGREVVLTHWKGPVEREEVVLNLPYFSYNHSNTLISWVLGLEEGGGFIGV